MNTKIHLIAANERTGLVFSLSPGQAHDAPEGSKWLAEWETPRQDAGLPMWMDRADEGEAMRQAIHDPALTPVVPPKRNRLKSWEYDKE